MEQKKSRGKVFPRRRRRRRFKSCGERKKNRDCRRATAEKRGCEFWQHGDNGLVVKNDISPAAFKVEFDPQGKEKLFSRERTNEASYICLSHDESFHLKKTFGGIKFPF